MNIFANLKIIFKNYYFKIVIHRVWTKASDRFKLVISGLEQDTLTTELWWYVTNRWIQTT